MVIWLHRCPVGAVAALLRSPVAALAVPAAVLPARATSSRLCVAGHLLLVVRRRNKLFLF
jgi:hypothetical protein